MFEVWGLRFDINETINNFFCFCYNNQLDHSLKTFYVIKYLIWSKILITKINMKPKSNQLLKEPHNVWFGKERGAQTWLYQP